MEKEGKAELGLAKDGTWDPQLYDLFTIAGKIDRISQFALR
jgi:hypothetical protein